MDQLKQTVSIKTLLFFVADGVVRLLSTLTLKLKSQQSIT